MSGWIGVDLDGTLAHAEDGNKQFGMSYIGPPVPLMLARVHGWLSEGREVRIVTARVSSATPSDLVEEARRAIDTWCLTHLCRTLPVQAEKDYRMVELWDDRAVQVVPNTGESLAELIDTLAHYDADVPGPVLELLRALSRQVGTPGSMK